MTFASLKRLALATAGTTGAQMRSGLRDTGIRAVLKHESIASVRAR
jgi:hypothetical protein